MLTVDGAIKASRAAWLKAARDYPKGVTRNVAYAAQAQTLLDAFAKLGVMDSEDPQIIKLIRQSKGNIATAAKEAARQQGVELGPPPETRPSWSISPASVVKRTDVHREYGGAGRGGIEPSRKTPNVLIFSDPEAGKRYGYTFDGWRDGIFHYTGDGQLGDQTWRGGNVAIRNHAQDGRALRVFDGVRGEVTYRGEFVLDVNDPYYLAEAADRSGEPRQVIVFRLRPVDVEQPADASPPDTPASARTVTSVQVEANNTESFLVSVEPRETEVTRREQRLVLAYKKWVERKGSTITRLRCVPAGELHALYNDVFDEARNNLIEAKGTATRAAVRMAIGQLADYVRFAPAGVARAVLTEDRPRRDLEALLLGEGISCIWRHGPSFQDNAQGRFT